MTTENKPEQKSTENTTDKQSNKTVFGPLGKYAVIAVIMVSIIVTTAIMLDKQLNSVDQHIAAIENEVANMNAAAGISASQNTDAEATSSAEPFTMESESAPAGNVETAQVESEKVVITETAKIEIASPLQVEADVNSDAQTATVAQTEATQTAPSSITAPRSSAIATKAAERRSKLDAKYQARIEAYKTGQKHRMSDMFARIEALEAKQLDDYKARQQTQISRLRQQIEQQQLLIDALVDRNEKSYNLRAANVQRVQQNREQILNRI